MLNLGDRVKYLDTGEIGIVVGYGKRIIHNKCLATAKVKLIDSATRKKTTIKDIDAKWFPCPEDYRISYPNPLAQSLIVNPAERFDLARSA